MKIEKKVRSMQTRSSQRGAVFVEAAIVIATFIIVFMGIVFFRDFYVKKIDVARLARASAIAYSMGACEAANPTDWAATDLGRGSTSTSQPVTNAQTSNTCTYSSSACQTNNQHQQSTATPANSSSAQAQTIMNGLPGMGKSDDTMLNPIGEVGLSNQARSSPRRGFVGTALSTSYVSCGDKVRTGSFENIWKVALDAFPLKL
jgi:hypothetical protein